MNATDQAIEEIRAVRHRLFAEHGQDISRYIAYLREEQKKFETRVKSVVCEAVLQKGVAAINQHRRDSLDALVQDLESRLARRGI